MRHSPKLTIYRNHTQEQAWAQSLPFNKSMKVSLGRTSKTKDGRFEILLKQDQYTYKMDGVLSWTVSYKGNNHDCLPNYEGLKFKECRLTSKLHNDSSKRSWILFFPPTFSPTSKYLFLFPRSPESLSLSVSLFFDMLVVAQQMPVENGNAAARQLNLGD